MAITKKQKVVWAIDPFEEGSETRSRVIATLQKLSKQGAEIEPVYVLSPDEYDLNVQFNSSWLKQLRLSAQKVLDQYLKKVLIEGLLPPQVIIEKRPSLSRAVQALVGHAVGSGADLIAAGTHARGGLPRFFLGSFAETLLLQSKVPVLVIGPHSKSPKFKQILFATDFGRSAEAAFSRVKALAKTHQSKVTLFYAVPHPFEPAIQSGIYLLGGGMIAFPDFVSSNQEKKRKIAERFAAQAKKEGIEVEVVFDTRHGSTTQSIVRYAEIEKADMIMMTAESGRVKSALIGSVTRQVVRTAPCPVWVMRAS